MGQRCKAKNGEDPGLPPLCDKSVRAWLPKADKHSLMMGKYPQYLLCLSQTSVRELYFLQTLSLLSFPYVSRDICVDFYFKNINHQYIQNKYKVQKNATIMIKICRLTISKQAQLVVFSKKKI